MFGVVPAEADQPDQFSVVFGNLAVLSPYYPQNRRDRRPKRSINFLMSDSPSSVTEREEWWIRVEEWVGKQAPANAQAKDGPTPKPRTSLGIIVCCGALVPALHKKGRGLT
jgi:hypothetical protein